MLLFGYSVFIKLLYKKIARHAVLIEAWRTIGLGAPDNIFVVNNFSKAFLTEISTLSFDEEVVTVCFLQYVNPRHS